MVSVSNAPAVALRRGNFRMHETKDLIAVKMIRWVMIFLIWFWNFGYYDVDAMFMDGYGIKIKGWKRLIVR